MPNTSCAYYRPLLLQPPPCVSCFACLPLASSPPILPAPRLPTFRHPQELEAAQRPLAAIAALPHLTRLLAVRCRVGKVDAPLLATLLALPQLKRLDLEAPRIRPMGDLDLVVHLNRNSGLQDLRLCSSQLQWNMGNCAAMLRCLTRLVRRSGAGDRAGMRFVARGLAIHL